MLIKLKKVFFYGILVPILFYQCQINSSSDHVVKSQIFDQAAVVSAHPEASKIGKEILLKGGNAIDAAIAVHFALSVCYPIAGNIGGGGFMVYRDKKGQMTTLDFREKAPATATEKMYLDKEGLIISKLSTDGHLSSGVPGSVDGMFEAFSKLSALKDWKALIQPSVELAEKGFKLTERQARNLNNKKESFKTINSHPSVFAPEEAFHANGIFIQEDLANTLKLIRDNGRAGFYEGLVAKQLVEEMEHNGGIISLEDLQNYRAIWREPIISNYKEYSIIGMGPPSSGGIAIHQLMQMMNQFPLESYEMHSVKSVHAMVEAERRVYADRSTHLGDADFYNVPFKPLLDTQYIQKRLSSFSETKATPSSDIKSGQFKESEETTHFSIIDKEGNAVSITSTLNGAYGSKVEVQGAGFLLNNEMDDFSSKPGQANMYGLIGAEANKIEPNKRMLSSMTPTIVEKNGALFMVIGTPGGSTIITSVFQTILNVIAFDQTISEAVHAPRFHHQWLPDKVFVEANCLTSEVREELTKMGHEIEERGHIGRVEAIQVLANGKLEAAADIRGDDHASGY